MIALPKALHGIVAEVESQRIAAAEAAAQAARAALAEFPRVTKEITQCAAKTAKAAADVARAEATLSLAKAALLEAKTQEWTVGSEHNERLQTLRRNGMTENAYRQARPILDEGIEQLQQANHPAIRAPLNKLFTARQKLEAVRSGAEDPQDDPVQWATNLCREAEEQFFADRLEYDRRRAEEIRRERAAQILQG